MKTKTNKSSKLRDFVCVVCNKPFQNYLAPADIKKGKGKVCSKKCKNILNGNQKRKGLFKKCLMCYKDFWCRPSENIKGNRHYKIFCSRKCFLARPTLRGKVNGNFISHDGYVMIQVGKNQIKEHRHIMEQILGRKLLHNEIVHHIDENRLNNKLENLKLMTRSEHNKLHFSINDGLTNTQRFQAKEHQHQKIA